MERTKVTLNGEEKEGSIMDFDLEKYNLNTNIDIEDGAKIKLQIMVKAVIKLDEKKPNGETVYAVVTENHSSLLKKSDSEIRIR
jgi:hypothetical protein